MAAVKQRGQDEIFNINVGGKKFSVRKSVLTADPQSKLCDWFKTTSSTTSSSSNNSKNVMAQDKAGNLFIDRDGRSFRYVINYLRLKRDKQLTNLALPAKPDALSNLLAEADGLKLYELRDMCLEMLQRYPHEEMGYAMAYTSTVLKYIENWVDSNPGRKVSLKNDGPDDNW